jgi:hypothetical protein
VFTPAEAVEFLARVAPGVPTGEDPDALVRIAQCCWADTVRPPNTSSRP